MTTEWAIRLPEESGLGDTETRSKVDDSERSLQTTCASQKVPTSLFGPWAASTAAGLQSCNNRLPAPGLSSQSTIFDLTHEPDNTKPACTPVATQQQQTQHLIPGNTGYAFSTPRPFPPSFDNTTKMDNFPPLYRVNPLSDINVKHPNSSSSSQPKPIPWALKFLTSWIVSLKIGRGHGAVSFNVHEDLLTAVSPVFGAAFSSKRGSGVGGFLEAERGVMRLPEERVEDWTYFLQWLHGRAGVEACSASSVDFGDGEGGRLSCGLMETARIGSETDEIRTGGRVVDRGRTLRTAGSFRVHLHRNPAQRAHTVDPRARLLSGSAESVGSDDDDDDGTPLYHGVNLLHHHLIDPALDAYHRHRSSTQAIHDHALAFGSTPLEATQLRGPKPTPPAFGPLVRLYLFADRFDVAGDLRGGIYGRVEEVAYGEGSSDATLEGWRGEAGKHGAERSREEEEKKKKDHSSTDSDSDSIPPPDAETGPNPAGGGVTSSQAATRASAADDSCHPSPGPVHDGRDALPASGRLDSPRPMRRGEGRREPKASATEKGKGKGKHPAFVPDPSDVRRLWEGVPHERADEGLKNVVLDLFVGMKGTGVFGDRIGGGGGDGNAFERGKEKVDREVVKEEYPPEFLRDLVARFLVMRRDCE